jgi:formylglycine-generating enzyme required for sulfatase activity
MGDVLVNSVGMELVWIEPGTFMMGSPEEEVGRWDGERQHLVTLTQGYYLGATEVTRGQFSAFVQATNYRTEAEMLGSAWTLDGSDNWSDVKGATWLNPGFTQDDSHPVVCVSWNDAVEFTKWLSGKEGRTYRLPTEAEWEYGCRAGTTTPFHTGETISTDQANYDGNYAYGAGRKGEYRDRTTPVGAFEPNAWGLYDMHGNAWEWCQDWYGDYPAGDAMDPSGPDGGADRVLRGGGWFFIPRGCRSAYRLGGDPGNRYSNGGFRLVAP